jgi:hypothetical protein
METGECSSDAADGAGPLLSRERESGGAQQGDAAWPPAAKALPMQPLSENCVAALMLVVLSGSVRHGDWAVARERFGGGAGV